MDWQQLPAIRGNKGFEYKISAIHLSSRVKFSRIVSQITSAELANFLVEAMKRLPPFYIVFTDNAMSFTMKYAHHSDRQTVFTRTAESFEVMQGLLPKGKPWYNGFIERSNRTDNDALFHRQEFSCSEERKYYLRLWEMHYNRERPHQSLAMRCPLDVATEQHPIRTANMALC